ncbi:uncharacterized protein LOC115625403 [Scaptodrosophila lebanonensis]|uniref:Uncharacterized protein LOC115625403 n=1 Tax=Drosophila lebanonensis TaxID=7225 RepID=A0A6J2TI00_DROLE|nr:uncharacterized protein LOC115625403 [Scaptodrosophila lebanonensis]
MANILGCSKLMMSRCVQMLGGAKPRVQMRRFARNSRGSLVVRPTNPQAELELEKSKVYKDNKRRSMWQQIGFEAPQPESTELPQKRLDDEHYKHRDIYEREYQNTWASYPEPEIEPPKIQIDNVIPPVQRRRSRDRPTTAKPVSSKPKVAFPEKNPHSVPRNRIEEEESDYCPPPAMSRLRLMDNEDGRRRQFHF